MTTLILSSTPRSPPKCGSKTRFLEKMPGASHCSGRMACCCATFDGPKEVTINVHYHVDVFQLCQQLIFALIQKTFCFRIQLLQPKK